MAGISIENIRLTLIDLIFKRIILLVMISVTVFYMTTDRHTLKIKTLNFLMPEAEDIRMLHERPEAMDKKRLKSLLIYYKTVCDFEAGDPEQPAPCSFAAYANYYLGKTTKAIRLYEQAAYDNQYFFWFRYNLGAIHFNQGEYEKAAKEFALALKTPPSNSMYFLLLTKTYKDAIHFIGLEPETLGKSMEDGYRQAEQYLLTCQLMINNPEMKKQLETLKIKLRLF